MPSFCQNNRQPMAANLGQAAQPVAPQIDMTGNLYYGPQAPQGQAATPAQGNTIPPDTGIYSESSGTQGPSPAPGVTPTTVTPTSAPDASTTMDSGNAYQQYLQSTKKQLGSQNGVTRQAQ